MADDDGEPEVIIIFANDNTIHAALGLGSVANIQFLAEVAPNVPALQQGKLKPYLLL